MDHILFSLVPVGGGDGKKISSYILADIILRWDI